MLQTDNQEYKDLRTVSYTFTDAGDVLPMHNHVQMPSTEHITIVARGSFLLRGAGWEQTVLSGALIDFSIEQWHEFESIEPNSKIINIMKTLGA